MKRFASLVESGEKHQTIRAKRKRPIRVSDKLYLYTGLRTKAARKLRESICTGVFDIKISEKDDVYIEDVCLFESMKHGFAYADGFRGLWAWKELLDTIRKIHGLPFHGDMIVWDEPCDGIRDFIKRQKENENG